MYKLYTMFDTKSVKITHFHLFIKEIILLFTSVQNISQNFDTRVLHFAQQNANFQIYQEKPKFHSSFHFFLKQKQKL